MKKLFLFLTIVLISNLCYSQVFDLKNRVFSLERIVGMDKDSLAKQSIIILYLENGIDIQIQKIDAVNHWQLFNTYPNCKYQSKSKLDGRYFLDIQKGNIQSYVVYFRAFYRLGKVYDYEFDIVDIKDLNIKYYLVTYVSKIPNNENCQDINDDILYVTLNDGISDTNLEINTKFNPVIGDVYCNDLVVKVRHGILEYYEVIRDKEIKEIIKAHNKIPTIE